MCVNRKVGCKTYDSLGRCSICESSYVLIRNWCYLRGCRQYNPQNRSECLECHPKFNYNQVFGCCQKQDQHCANFNQFCLCESCVEGYFFEEGAGFCIPNP